MISKANLRRVLRDRLGKDWYEFLEDEINKDYFAQLVTDIAVDRKSYTVYPDKADVLKAFQLTPLNSVKVVIMGQDPYHDGNAMGLAFASINNNPSLDKIMTQLRFYEEFGELEMCPSRSPTLEYLAEQGILLLNRILTVRRRQVRSHVGWGWEIFTAEVVKRLSYRKGNIVFILWGNDAKDLTKFIKYQGNMILTAEHPAAACYANRAWKDNRCFQKTNEYLDSINKKIINW